MEKKKKLIILGVIVLILAISGLTYAILTWTSSKINIGLTSGCFTIDYTKGQDISGNLKLLNESDLISSNKFTIKNGIGISAVNIGIKSTCTIEGFGSIYLNVTNISDAFTTGDSKGALKYVVLSNTSTITTPSSVTVDSLLNQSFEIVAKGSIESSGKKLLYKMELSNTEINKYIIVIYVDNFLAGNSITSATFSGNISSEAEQKSPDYDANFRIETNEEDGTATITHYVGEEKDIVIPKMLRKVTITFDVVSNPSAEAVSACESFFINDMGISSEYIGDICKNGKSTDGATLKDFLDYWKPSFNIYQQFEKNGSITNLQTSYSSEKYLVTKLGVLKDSTSGESLSINDITSISLPDSLIEIGNSVLAHGKFSNIVIPNSVASIGWSAFSDGQLTSIILPDSVTTIGTIAFYNNQLTNVIIPDSVTTIGIRAFASNNLNYVLINSGSKLTSIGQFAFSTFNYSNSNFKIYNNSGKAFDWNYAVNGTEGTAFVTGTTNAKTSGSTRYNAVTVTTGQPS